MLGTKSARSEKRNKIYHAVNTVFVLCTPLIMLAYLTRVLTPAGVGQYSYASSVITYFTVFAALGFGYYARRELVKERDNAYNRSCLFWDIFLCRLIPTLIALCINVTLSLTGAYGEKSFLMLVMSSNVVAVAIDVGFVFRDLGDYGKIVARNVAVKIITMLFTFLFVRTPGDVWKYELIHYGAAIAGNIVMWAGIPGLIIKVKLSDLRPMRHLPETLRLFVPTIVLSVYTMIDKTLIGAITHSDAENGYYEMSDVVVRTALTAVISINALRMPRIERELRNGHEARLKEEIYTSAAFVWFAGSAAAALIPAAACNLGAAYLGERYVEAEKILSVLAFLPLVMGLSNTMGTQYLIPSGQDKKFTAAVLTGAVVNISLNIPFIIFFGAFGAAVATIIAECFVTVIMIIFAKSKFHTGRLFICGIKNIIAGGVAFAATYSLSRVLPQGIGYGLIALAAGIASYILVLAILRSGYLFACFKTIAANIRRSRAMKSARKKTDVSDALNTCEGVVYTEHDEADSPTAADMSDYADDASAEHSQDYDS